MYRQRRRIPLAALVLTLAAGVPARAQVKTPAQRADELNEQGKLLFEQSDYAGAAAKFRNAILFSAEGRFYFNLCYALARQQNYWAALTACEQVEPNGASNPLKAMNRELMATIETRLAEENAARVAKRAAASGNAGEEATESPGSPRVHRRAADPATAPPPSPIAVQQTATDATYRWSVGGALGWVSSNLGAKNGYGTTGVGFKAHLDFLLSKERRWGLQAYLNVSDIEPGAFSERLEVFDLGAALFSHRPISERLFWTPLLGLHLSVMQPESITDTSSLATAGGRGEIDLTYLLDRRRHHALTWTAALNVYLPAQPGPAGLEPSRYGLNRVGRTVIFGFGYTYRFSFPLRLPIFILQ